MGRPTKLTPEVQAAIVKAIERGNAGETAAEANGVSTRTFYEWLQRGREAKADDPEREAYAQFAHDVEGARARAEVYAVRVLRAGMKGDPRLAIEWLRRARHRTWEPAQTVKVTGSVTGLPTDKKELLRAIQAELTRVRGDDADDGGADPGAAGEG